MNLHSFLQNPLDSIALLPPGGVLPLDAEARLYDPLSRLVGRKAASKVLTAVGAEGVRRLSAVEIASAISAPSAPYCRHTCFGPGQVALPGDCLRRGRPLYSWSL